MGVRFNVGGMAVTKVKGRKIARATCNLLNIVYILNQAEKLELGKTKNV